MQNETILEGAISVKAATEASNRDVFRIYTDEKKVSRDFGYICRKAREKGIECVRTTAEKISEMTRGSTHGGICAVVGERRYAEPETLFECEDPFIVLLEGIEDPYNFGDIIRSVYAAGATGLIVPRRNWMSADTVVARASAGASEFINAAATDDFVPFLKEAKSRGLSVVAADRKDAVNMYSADLRGPLVLAIGGSYRGLSKPVYDEADKKIFIPYGNAFRNSLSAAGAAAAISFEILRRRSENKE